jgi:branched-chain amino acid transport system ATP-binding protein
MKPLLQVEHLKKSFGGLRVTDDVSFTIQPQEIAAIIGPNGAGKTTLFNQITGHLPPDGGRILFGSADLMGLMPQRIVKMGIGRSFQVASIFPDETVLDNVRAACMSNLNQTRNLWRPVEQFSRATEQAYPILESLGLEQRADRMAYELAHGDQKLLDIGIALALEPKLLLMDEPTAGMSPEERQLTRQLIKKLWTQYRLTLIFIEHDMDMVFGIAERIIVLNHGALIADETPESIRSNKEVITAYLGEETG